MVVVDSLQAYSWVAVIVLPINSVINPVLYTLSTERFPLRASVSVGTTVRKMSRSVSKQSSEVMTAETSDGTEMRRVDVRSDSAPTASPLPPSSATSQPWSTQLTPASPAQSQLQKEEAQEPSEKEQC